MMWMLAAVTLGSRPVPAGIHVESSHATGFEVEIRAARLGQRVGIGKQHEQITELDVRTADGDGPLLFDLSWRRNHQTDHGPDGSRSFDLPVVGRRYVVDRLAGSVTPQHDGAGPEELSIAHSASDLFALLAELRAMLGPEGLSVGDQRPAGAMFAGLLRDAPGQPTVRGTLTVTGVVDGLMSLALLVTLESEGELRPGVWTEVRADLQGIVQIEVQTGWTRRLVASGPVRITGHTTRLGRRIKLEGEGTFISNTTLEFR